MTKEWNEFKSSVSDSANLENFDVSAENLIDSSEPDFTNSQLTREEYEEVINDLTKAAMNDPKKYYNKDFFNKNK